VVATSSELKYIFEIGEQFVLNNIECEGCSMDIVTGTDAAGDQITHLVLFVPFVIPSSGRSRYMLACLIDVTRLIQDTATLPELEKGSNTSTAESDPRTPLQDSPLLDWDAPRLKLSSEDLLGGCVLPSDREYSKSLIKEPQNDIWLHLANEERYKGTPARGNSRSTQRSNQNMTSSFMSHTSDMSDGVDEVLHDFIGGLQQLYSDFFLLGRSPLDHTSYEICNVSPTVYEAKDYIHGHLSLMGLQGIAELSAHLARDNPFEMEVKWGDRGLAKRLYCSPLYGQDSITWLCFLVDMSVARVW
jgi:hypothetical protein